MSTRRAKDSKENLKENSLQPEGRMDQMGPIHLMADLLISQERTFCPSVTVKVCSCVHVLAVDGAGHREGSAYADTASCETSCKLGGSMNVHQPGRQVLHRMSPVLRDVQWRQADGSGGAGGRAKSYRDRLGIDAGTPTTRPHASSLSAKRVGGRGTGRASGEPAGVPASSRAQNAKPR
eukprot:351062-Chlamydomonas_euryale.AAC.6